MTSHKPRVIFMGSPDIAVPALAVAADCCEVSLVVTQPDRPAGRGRKLRPPPIKVAAEERGLPVWQPATLRGAEADERLGGHDLFIVMAYGELLRQPVLDLPTACINLHASLLPRWRGASPLQAALHAGDRVTGVSVMEMVRKLDAGPVYLQREIALDDTATLPWLHDRMATVAADALRDFLTTWPHVQAEAQDPALVTTCGKLTTDHGRLDWTAGSRDLDRQIRAYHPMPGCWCLSGEDRLRIHQVRLAPQEPTGTAAPGTTLRVGREPAVVTGDGILVLERVQPPGSRAMDGESWVNGHQIPALLT